MDLTNSKRLLFSANHVTTELSEQDRRERPNEPEGALRKLAFVRALKLDDAQIQRLQPLVRARQDKKLDRVLDAVASVSRRSHFEASSVLAPLPVASLLELAELTRELRPADAAPPLPVLLEAFKQQQKVSPVGRLHLERMEMYPVGVEKGELVFTVPMAPGETVTVSHKEWSTTSNEYEQIVQDAFESYSERGVAEKTDASMSAENETKHSDRLNFGSTLTGSYGPVSLTTSLGLDNSSDERNSVSTSIRKNSEITTKASARTRQEHKVSVKLEAKKGVEDSSFRTISNRGHRGAAHRLLQDDAQVAQRPLPLRLADDV